MVAAHPKALVTDNYVLVTSRIGTEHFVHAFERRTGRFVAKVGHRGGDPKAYTDFTPYYNAYNDLLYFERIPNQLQKYDWQGNYHGRAFVPVWSMIGKGIITGGLLFLFGRDGRLLTFFVIRL